MGRRRTGWTIGLDVIGGFFCATALLSAWLLLGLIWPASPVAAIWRLRPERLTEFRSMGAGGLLLLGVLVPLLTAAAIGVLTRKRWGWWLASAIFVINGVANLVTVALGRLEGAGPELLVIGLVVFLLLKPVRRRFTGSRYRPSGSVR